MQSIFSNTLVANEGDGGNGKPEKIYDLKQQYKDTLKLNDGTFMEVPVWLKNPNWKKPEETPKPIL